MFICDQRESDNACISNAGNEVVKDDGLTFSAQGKNLILQRKINAMRKIFATIAVALCLLRAVKMWYTAMAVL